MKLLQKILMSKKMCNFTLNNVVDSFINVIFIYVAIYIYKYIYMYIYTLWDWYVYTHK